MAGLLSEPINLRQSIHGYLSEEFDPMGQYSQYGLKTPIRKGDVLNAGLNVAPGIGDVMSAVDALRSYQSGDYLGAGLSGMGALPMIPGFFGGITQKIGKNPTSLASRMGERGASRPLIEIAEPDDVLRFGQRVSTANPTEIAAEKIGFHQTPQYEINGGLLRDNPEAFASNMARMKEYLPTKKRTPEGRYNDYLDHMSGNLEYLMGLMPKEFSGRAGNWYKGANALANDFADAYNIPVEAAAGVLARLSPGMDWFHNVEQADRLIDIWRHQQDTKMPATHWDNGTSAILSQRPELLGTYLKDMPNNQDKADWIRAFDEQTTPASYYSITPEGALGDMVMNKDGVTPSKIMWQSNKNLELALGMLDDPSVENISRMLGVGGHKIRSFYNNIVDPYHPRDTTVDTHAVSASHLVPYSNQSLQVNHAFGSGASKSGMSRGMYGLYANAYQNVADNLGLTPQQVQSPTWEMVRAIFPQTGAGKDSLRNKLDAGPRQQLMKGLLSPDDYREQVIDLATEGKGITWPSWYKK